MRLRQSWKSIYTVNIAAEEMMLVENDIQVVWRKG